MAHLGLWRGCILALLPALAPMIVCADLQSEHMAALNITAPKQRLPAPDFRLRSVDGGEIDLSDYRGRLVLLNFWATFCAPCREEMPALESLWREFKADGFVVLAVAADRGSEAVVNAYIRDGDFTFPVPLDPQGTVRNAYEVRALPTTYLIGRDGKFLGRALGVRDWANTGGRTLIRTLLSHKTMKDKQAR